jgi:membrane protein implicated in regulation of membrane protease activity
MSTQNNGRWRTRLRDLIAFLADLGGATTFLLAVGSAIIIAALAAWQGIGKVPAVILWPLGVGIFFLALAVILWIAQRISRRRSGSPKPEAPPPTGEIEQVQRRIEVTRIELIEKTFTLGQMEVETIRCPPTYSWDSRWQEITVLDGGDRQPRIRPIHDGTGPGQRGITVQNYGHPVEPMTVRVRGACRSQPISLD